MESSTFPVNRDKAMMVLTSLVNMNGVKEVQIVGSIARNGEGNDLDVVLIVGEYTYATFLAEMWRALADSSLEDDYYVDFSGQRIKAAITAISPKTAERGWFELAAQQLGAPVDIHLMPVDWQQNVDKVQHHLPHHDREFVSNIARDARRVEVWADDPDGMIEITRL